MDAKREGKTLSVAFVVDAVEASAKWQEKRRSMAWLEWIKERQGDLRRQLNWPKRFPTNSTSSEALAHCNAQEIVTVIAQVRQQSQSGGTVWERTQPLAGKQTGARRLPMWRWMAKPCAAHWDTRARHSQRSHLVSLYECQSGIVLTRASGAEPARMREVAAAALVHPALVKGRIISTDAMHTQKKWCACVHMSGGYYLTVVKKNQPQM